MKGQQFTSRSTWFLGCAASILLGLALVAVSIVWLPSPAAAQGPDVRIAKLECESEPELVVIENRGLEAQDLTGWRLESDPPSQEVFDLSVVNTLLPGESVFIEAGPGTGGIFAWSQEFVFRDGDPTDYARLVDGAGSVVDQANCPGQAPLGTPEPTPTPTPTPQPTPTPVGSPAAEVPNGGGPPPAGEALPAAVLMVTGGLVMVGGIAGMTLPWLRRPGGGPKPRGRGRGSQTKGGLGLGGTLVVLAAVALVSLVVFMAGRRDP